MTDSKAKREKGEAPTRADDDGMAQSAGHKREQAGERSRGQTGRQVDKDDLKDADRDEDNLDEGLEELMDASDPPSSTQP